MQGIRSEAIVALRMSAATLVLTGLLYPLLVAVLAGALFPERAAGSLVERDGRVLGSELVAQRFTSPAYFQPRPSAASAAGYDAAASSGSNLGPTSRRLRERVAVDLARLRAANPQAPGPVPVELVTASGSGLDPHLSPAGAAWQLPRVAAARGISTSQLEPLVARRVARRTLGVLGEPRINVLLLNLDLDASFGPPGAGTTMPHEDTDEARGPAAR